MKGKERSRVRCVRWARWDTHIIAAANTGLVDTVGFDTRVTASVDGSGEPGVDIVDGVLEEPNGLLDTAQLGVDGLAPAVDGVLL
jgi:hypothetical protein